MSQAGGKGALARSLCAACAIPAVLVAAMGCSTAGTGAFDCATVVRLGATEYIERGFTRDVGTPLGDADLSECDDVGADARGAYFPEDPTTVNAWAVPGFDTSDVVAITYNDRLYGVLVSEDAARHIQARVIEQFSKR